MKMYPTEKERHPGFFRVKAQIVYAGLASWYQQLEPFSNIKNQVDTCVIGNGIPKSCTYLINRTIEFLGEYKNSKVHINSLHWDVVPDSRDIVMNFCLPGFAIKKLKNRYFAAAHLPWSNGVERSIAHVTDRRHIKHVFMYRDPRDTFIGCMNFLTYSSLSWKAESSRKEHKFLVEFFSSDEERLAYIIGKRRTYKFSKYSPWLTNQF